MRHTTIIPPESFILILGDGQLGKMLALAAALLGMRVIVLGRYGRESPAGIVAYDAYSWGENIEVSDELLDKLCKIVKVALVEWENVPVELMQRIEKRRVPVCSGSAVLAIAQDRLKEKRYAQEIGISVPKFRAIVSETDVSGENEFATEASILKTCRGGYDGKGQEPVAVGESIKKAWNKLEQKPSVLERRVDFDCEISVIVAQSATELVCYPPFLNVHRGGILRTTRYPSLLNPRVLALAEDAAKVLAQGLGNHGLLAVEFFVTKEDKVLFNEMAPRPHNSGHLTGNCCNKSQFDLHVLAACNLPLGKIYFHSAGVMQNLIGSEVENWPEHLRNDRAGLHIYGKGEPSDDRKMGHVTRVGKSLNE